VCLLIAPADMAGLPFNLLRAVCFFWTHCWPQIFETSAIDYILLGIKNDIRHCGTHFFQRQSQKKQMIRNMRWGKKIVMFKKTFAGKKVAEIFPSTIHVLFLPWTVTENEFRAQYQQFSGVSFLDFEPDYHAYLYGDMAIT
jgi:hypothetical protein